MFGRPTGARITYRIDRDAILIAELRPDGTGYAEAYSAAYGRLAGYDRYLGSMEPSPWKTGSIADFLDLTPDQVALVDIRLELADELRRWRWAHHCKKQDLARLLGTSPSRLCKMEAPDPSVSLDLLVTSLLSLGVSRERLGDVIRGCS